MKLLVKPFKELTLNELYKILKLRFDIFVVEQKSIYDEFDEKDYDAMHIFFKERKDVVAYLRICKKSSKTANLERVVVSSKFRRKGLGRKIIKKGIDHIKSKMKVDKIEISAQYHLVNFYGSFGFKNTSKVYDDCGIPHIDMVMDI